MSKLVKILLVVSVLGSGLNFAFSDSFNSVTKSSANLVNAKAAKVIHLDQRINSIELASN